ncbi:MAG: YkgJ family cysteine cluster protein [Polyangiaceae bacterium]|nr:YkgJ family cysteine cluster protein [Polyangiaceae bacterium]
MAEKLSTHPGQRFACRDCPARCCRLPASVAIDADDAARFLAEPWVRERLPEQGLAILERGVLPMREVERGLRCAFLDDDRLCGLQKRFGEAYLPRACQAFPFGFTRNEKDVTVAQLSQLCPSIRDNYGEPVDAQLRGKLAKKGATERMSTAMATLRGVILPRTQYLRVAAGWDEALASDAPPLPALARIYEATRAFEDALPLGSEKVPDAAVDAALAEAAAREPEPLGARRAPSFHARVVFAYLLGNLCYPSRVRLAQRMRTSASRFEALWSFGNKLAWLLGRGTVDLLYVPRPFKLQRVRRVARFLAADGAEARRVAAYLRLVLARRQILSRPRHLMAVVLDLSLAAAVISRFARCRAAADERTTVSAEDVGEGISIAELVLLSHRSLTEDGRLMKNLRWLLLTKPERFRGVLEGEA